MTEVDGRRALIVEDTTEFRELVSDLLRSEGFEVATAGDGEEGVRQAWEFSPDLVILDLALPRLDGVEVCRQIRTFSDAYVVMLTARAEEVDKLIGLSVGADDYVTKPFSPRELVARVQAMLRRPRGGRDDEADRERRIGHLTVDALAREVRVKGDVIELTRREFDLLDALSEHPRVTLSRDELLERVWGKDWYGDRHVVDVHISNLRRKLEQAGLDRYVRTVRGVGYRLERAG